MFNIEFSTQPTPASNVNKLIILGTNISLNEAKIKPKETKESLQHISGKKAEESAYMFEIY